MDNKIYSSAQVVTLATAQTYTLKADEVFINDSIYKKTDIALEVSNNGELTEPLNVGVGIKKRDGVRNIPADLSNYSEWTIDDVVQTTLTDCLSGLNVAIS